MDLYIYERRLIDAGFSPIAGADEAGRGACAGPLVAAAVILNPNDPIDGLNDSKKLTAKRRCDLAQQIQQKALAWAVSRIEADECDHLGMQEADLQGLRRAIVQLDPLPAYALTDGFFVPGLPMPSLALWKGDQVAASISAASILAKVIRDQIMDDYDNLYTGYGFSGHKGYCTKVHQQALETYGPCEIHRRSYSNVQQASRRHERSTVSQPLLALE